MARTAHGGTKTGYTMGRISTNQDCRSWMRGTCTRENCKFIHDPKKEGKNAEKKTEKACWSCGSTSHLRHECPRQGASKGQGSKSKRGQAAKSITDRKSARKERRSKRMSLKAVKEKKGEESEGSSGEHLNCDDSESDVDVIYLNHCRIEENIAVSETHGSVPYCNFYKGSNAEECDVSRQLVDVSKFPPNFSHESSLSQGGGVILEGSRRLSQSENSDDNDGDGSVVTEHGSGAVSVLPPSLVSAQARMTP